VSGDGHGYFLAIREKGKVSPNSTGSYFRLVWGGMADSELRRYVARFCGVGTARAIAHAYSVFATGGTELGMRRETLDLLAAPAPPRHAAFTMNA